jgi:hypothetical protein
MLENASRGTSAQLDQADPTIPLARPRRSERRLETKWWAIVPDARRARTVQLELRFRFYARLDLTVMRTPSSQRYAQRGHSDEPRG